MRYFKKGLGAYSLKLNIILSIDVSPYWPLMNVPTSAISKLGQGGTIYLQSLL
jgi:hypothetical protein